MVLCAKRHATFLVSGSLGAFKTGTDGKQEFIGHIRQGEPVGEFALIAGEPHANSVYALRDSEVLALDRATFSRLIRRHPELMANLARTVLFRSRQNRRKNPRAEPRVFALIAASPSIDVKARAQSLVAALAEFGKRAIVVDSHARDYNAAWFDQLERDHDFVLLVSGTATGAWTHLCRRRADRIWICGRVDARPSDMFTSQNPSAAEAFQMVDVVLVRGKGAQGRPYTHDWISMTGAQRVFHWRDGDPNSISHLVRVMTATSIGLVLGGGGARAYAHIGALRALRETGLTLDFVGGTSMGGVVGACFAMGWSDSEIERRIYDGFVRTSPLDDFILPVVSLTAGRKVNARLALHFGDSLIEDLEVPFFCVSANMTQGTVKVHKTGSLAHSLRASIALPGILPPVVWGEDVLVDGAALDNFPVSTMRDMHRGPNIGVDVAQQHALDSEDFRHPLGFMSWVMRYGFKRAPPIAELLMRSATVTLQTPGRTPAPDLLVIPELEGIQLRDWKAYDRAVEAGYQAMQRALKSAPLSLR
jgi:NTE family protein